MGLGGLGPGAALTALAAIVAGSVAGPAAAGSAAVFGALATAIQAASRRLMRGQERAPLREFMKRWGAGMALRGTGVVLVGVVVWLEPAALPPLPAALSYIGVLVPLLFLEARRV